MSTPTKRARAATATNGHTLKQKAVPAISVAQGHGLGELAARLADLEGLYGLTCHAKSAAEREVKSVAGVYLPEAIDASKAASLFGDVNSRAHDLTDAIQELILLAEPRTLDETLSLVLVYNQQIAIYLNDVRENPDNIKDDEMFRRECRLDRTRQAIIRGLVHSAGATSPLLTKYAHPEEDLATWDQLCQKATVAAKQYPSKPQAQARKEVER